MAFPLRFYAPLAFFCLSFGLSACQHVEIRERRVDPAELPCASLQAKGTWQSAPWFDAATQAGCPWVEYQGLRALTFDHSLGSVPAAVLVYVSFDRNGKGAVLAAGDMAKVIAANETEVSVENRTKQGLFARFVLY